MKKGDSNIKVFLDNGTDPIAEGNVPNQLEIDTRSIKDGPHTLRIIATDVDGISNEKLIPFVVRNGPYIAVNGLKDNAVVDDKINLILDAYGETSLRDWRPNVVEVPTGVPFWYWGVALLILTLAMYYAIAFWSPQPEYFNSDSLTKEIKVNEISNDL